MAFFLPLEDLPYQSEDFCFLLPVPFPAYLLIKIIFKIFIYLEDNYKGRAGERGEIFHLPLCFPNGKMTGAVPGVQSFFQISHTGAGAQTLGPSPIAFPGTLPGIWIKSRAART